MKLIRVLTLGAFVLGVLAIPAAAQSLPDAVIANLETLRDKSIMLAEAVPFSSYSHQVHPDIRSFGDEVTHIASSAFRHGNGLGAESPDVPEAWLRGTIVSQAATVSALRAAFDHLFASIGDIDDVNAMISGRGGRQSSVNATLVGIVSHLQEHLGKAITEARAAGVVPPWSEG
jgi:hypothetical protein